MKQILTSAGAALLALAACGGVDRAGTRDEIVDSIEQMGGTADSDCIDGVFDRYSDDQLEAIDAELGGDSGSLSEEASTLMRDLGECFTFQS